MSKISIIIPCLNEEKYIGNCIRSVLESDYPHDDMEIIIVDGGSTDNTINIINDYQQKHSFIKLMHNSKKIVPISMNIGTENASGEYIIRLDAHASYPKDYFSKLIHYHQVLDGDNIGGVWNTEVLNQNKLSMAIKNVLSDKFGVGGAKFRTGVYKVEEVDTVPFGCFKKKIFQKVGLYDERLVRNQDIELNKRIKKAGGKIYLVPDIECTYYARETFKDLAKNNFANGKWNILTAYYTKRLSSLSIRHFIPLFFVLSLILPLLCCYHISVMIFVLYLSVITARSFQIKKETTLLYQVFAFLVLHVSYGFGSLSGVFDVIKLFLKEKDESI